MRYAPCKYADLDLTARILYYYVKVYKYRKGERDMRRFVSIAAAVVTAMAVSACSRAAPTNVATGTADTDESYSVSSTDATSQPAVDMTTDTTQQTPITAEITTGQAPPTTAEIKEAPQTTEPPSTTAYATTQAPSTTVEITTGQAPSTTTPTNTTQPPSTTSPATTKTPSTIAPTTTTQSPSTTAPATIKIPSTTAPTTTKAHVTTQPAPAEPAFDEAAALKRPDVDVRLTSSPGELTAKGGDAVIDYSKPHRGYVTVRYDGADAERRILRVATPSGALYDYIFTPVGEWAAFPLTEGAGTYTVTLYQSNGSKYYALVTASVAAQPGEFDPYLLPSYYVNYTGKSPCVKIAAALAEGASDEFETIYRIYHYVASSLSYDYDLAAKVGSIGGYIPDLDKIIKTKKGICFDYASLMTAMLRSRGIPAKLVFGYAGTVYHAWINVWTEKTGWITALISFDGNKWEIMDATYASTGYADPDKFVPDPANYKAVYYY